MSSTAVKDKVFHFVLTVVTTAFFTSTALFGAYSTSATSISLVVKRFSSAVAVLRILQSLTSASTSFLLNYTLEVIQWTFMQSKRWTAPSELSKHFPNYRFSWHVPSDPEGKMERLGSSVGGVEVSSVL
jgi:hypothetical protein